MWVPADTRARAWGLAYPDLPGENVYDEESNLKETDGFFVMAQVVLGKFDVNGGFGRTTINPTALDRTADPNSPVGQPIYGVLNTQTGTSGAVVFHAADWLHFDLDVFYAYSQWNLGESQKIFFYNAGTTITW